MHGKLGQVAWLHACFIKFTHINGSFYLKQLVIARLAHENYKSPGSQWQWGGLCVPDLKIIIWTRSQTGIFGYPVPTTIGGIFGYLFPAMIGGIFGYLVPSGDVFARPIPPRSGRNF